MKQARTDLVAALAAVLMTAILAVPIAAGEGSGAAPIIAAVAGAPLA